MQLIFASIPSPEQKKQKHPTYRRIYKRSDLGHGHWARILASETLPMALFRIANANIISRSDLTVHRSLRHRRRGASGRQWRLLLLPLLRPLQRHRIHVQIGGGTGMHPIQVAGNLLQRWHWFQYSSADGGDGGSGRQSRWRRPSWNRETAIQSATRGKARRSAYRHVVLGRRRSSPLVALLRSR